MDIQDTVDEYIVYVEKKCWVRVTSRITKECMEKVLKLEHLEAFPDISRSKLHLNIEMLNGELIIRRQRTLW